MENQIAVVYTKWHNRWRYYKQGDDALYPLWFCLALRPLTKMLNSQKKGFILPQLERQISQLWYMDDLKIYAKTKKHLQGLLMCVRKFISDIQMKFRLDKCQISGMEKGKWVEHQGYDQYVQIREL